MSFSDRPLISIIIPCRNEKTYIVECLASIAANDYPKDKLDVLVVDGLSDDGTREALEALCSVHPFLRVINNPEKITPFALNRGIREANGELVMLMSAHATYDPSAIRLSAEYAAKYPEADNIGGVWRIHPRGTGLMGKMICAALSDSFGVGGATYRTVGDGQPRWVDTAAYGCYRREVFQKVGLFNEYLVRGQDMEFNLRLKAAGGKTLLVPQIIIHYYARSDFPSFCRHNFRNGLWAILPFLHSSIRPVSPRHLAPLAFAVSLTASGIWSIFCPWGRLFFSVISSSYLIAAFLASLRLSLRNRDPRYLLPMPFIFASLHLAYGFGSLFGVFKALKAKITRKTKA
jgi:glycosyltransferase involved in cell wall biosynthesis